MTPRRCARVAAAVALAFLAACAGSTGGELVTFDAAAAGPIDAAGGPMTFPNARGYSITLTRAALHIGALYLNRAVPISGGGATSCVLPGIYSGEVTTGVDVDLLRAAPTPFPSGGQGTSGIASTAEVWLTGGAIDAAEDATPILVVEGTATRGATSLRFAGTVTIGKNRDLGSSDPSEPSASPICRQRIVSPIAVALPVSQGGSLVVRVDPRALFRSVEFADLLPEGTPAAGASPAAVAFPDAPASGSGGALFAGLHAADTYRFVFTPARGSP